MKNTHCSICGQPLDDPSFASRYPNFVCRACDARAVNQDGMQPEHHSMEDAGDNPEFVDGIQCWRRYKFGGYITMRDDDRYESIGEFYDAYGAIF